MSSTLQLGGATTGPIAPVIDSSSNAKSPNHGINLTSHLNSQHGAQNNTTEMPMNSNATVHPNTIPPALTMCSPVKVNNENSTNCTLEKTNIEPVLTAVTKPVPEMQDDKEIPPSNDITNNTPKMDVTNDTLKTDVINDTIKTDVTNNAPKTDVTNNTPKTEVTNDAIENKTEVLSSMKNNLNHTPIVPVPSTLTSTNEIVSSVTSTKATDDEQNTSAEALCINAKEDCESPKISTLANNNVTSSTNSPPNVVSSSTTSNVPESNVTAQSLPAAISTTVQPAENRTPVKPANTMKLATVPTRTHIKRKRDLKANTSSKKNLTDDAENEENSGENDQKSKRARVKTQPYQSPLPEFAIITKLSANMAKTKANDDKLVIFYKNEFLAVRNSEGSFYVCQAMQNIYKSSPKIRIRWLSQNKDDASGETYSPDFYDVTDFDCILTNLNLNRMDKGLYKLPASELERTQSILQRALDVEQGIASPTDITEEHPDGLDLSLYRDEAQLDNKKSRKTNKKKKVKINVDEPKASRDPLRATSSKSKNVKKSNKKRKASKASPSQAAKSKLAKSKISTKKVVEAVYANKAVASSSKSRQIRAILVQPSTSKAKTSTVISKRKVPDPVKVTTNSTRTKGRSTTRNTSTAPIATTSRASRASKLIKETRRSTK